MTQVFFLFICNLILFLLENYWINYWIQHIHYFLKSAEPTTKLKPQASKVNKKPNGVGKFLFAEKSEQRNKRKAFDFKIKKAAFHRQKPEVLAVFMDLMQQLLH